MAEIDKLLLGTVVALRCNFTDQGVGTVEIQLDNGMLAWVPEMGDRVEILVVSQSPFSGLVGKTLRPVKRMKGDNL